jgi:diguanylate cyclase (GGDEF)-like protein/PAS domain S-box-containing protein
MNAVHFLKARSAQDTAPERRGRISVFRRAQDWLRQRGANDQTALINALPAHVAVLDAQGGIVSVNKAWLKFEAAEPNYGPGPKVGRNYLDICDSASEFGLREAQQLATGIRSVLTGAAEIFSMDCSSHSSSEQRWFALTVTRLGDGPTRGAIVMHRDITEERALENSLRASEFRFRQMAESMRDVFFLIDAVSLQLLYISPAYEVIWGRSCESLDANRPPWIANVHPEDREFAQSKYDTGMLAGIFVYECRILRPDGSVRWIEVRGSPVLDTAGVLLRVTGTIEDITHRKQALQALQDSRQRLDNLVVAATDAIVTLDEDLRVVLSNPAAESMFGYSTTALRGEPLHKLLSEPLRAPRSLAIANFRDPGPDSAQGNASRQVMAVRKNGEKFKSEASISTFNANGRRYFTATLRDLSGRPLPSDQLRESQRIAGDLTEQQQSDIRIKRLSRVYTVLSEINALIVRVRDRQELFSETCRIAVDAGTFSMAWIGVIDSQTLQGKVVASHGGKQEYVSGINLTALEDTADSQRPECRALRQARPIICNDVAADPSVLGIRDELLSRGHKSLGCFPLLAAGRATAVLTFYAAEPNAFDEGEARLLLELAGNIAFALDHLEKQERLNYLACYDELTGLANRGLFLERVAQFVRGAKAGGDRLVLGIIDLERFKNINQSLGRESGDVLLRQAAEWLAQTLLDTAFLARIGADQFAVVFPTSEPEAELGRLTEQRIEAFLRHPFRLNDAVFHIGTKVGIALYPENGADADMLLRNAEAALRKAKMAGDRYLFYSPRMTETVVARLNLENMMRQALDKEQFVLYYQPKFSLLSGKITGAEALIRWNDPRTGLVRPGRFIPVLEETGLIHEVGRWALHRAIQDYARWRASGLLAVRIAVNVSALQLRSQGFIDQVKRAVTVDVEAASGLELEITESVVMEDVRHSGVTLRAIRAMGVSIAIDDFGTGFSSLSYLSKLPLDALKIDRSFVHDMTAGMQGTALVSTIIKLAHSLRLNVVAEGVETEEQSAVLHALDCDESQGHLLGRPVPSELFELSYLAPLALL